MYLGPWNTTTANVKSKLGLIQKIIDSDFPSTDLEEEDTKEIDKAFDTWNATVRPLDTKRSYPLPTREVSNKTLLYQVFNLCPH